MKYFTSDLHLGHANIIKYCNRPFESVSQMDDTIIKNINSRARKTDELYILGDLSLKTGEPAIAGYRKRIICKRINFILGNHDPINDCLKPKSFLEKYFVVATHRYVTTYRSGEIKQKFYMDHYPMESNFPTAHSGGIHLYGHLHQKNADHGKRKMLNVGVDQHGFFPISAVEIIEMFQNK